MCYIKDIEIKIVQSNIYFLFQVFQSWLVRMLRTVEAEQVKQWNKEMIHSVTWACWWISLHSSFIYSEKYRANSKTGDGRLKAIHWCYKLSLLNYCRVSAETRKLDFNLKKKNYEWKVSLSLEELLTRSFLFCSMCRSFLSVSALQQLWLRRRKHSADVSVSSGRRPEEQTRPSF